MCGIFGYIGTKDSLQVCLNGLQLLEYRGYDSTGIAGVENGQIAYCKEAGKLHVLQQKLPFQKLDVAIGHTRWATHGKVSSNNAHPHLDEKCDIALVHNGIIENYDVLRSDLQMHGVRFVSETDSEVIVQLIAHHYKGELVEAVQKVLPLLKGHFAIAVIHKDFPDRIVAAARECPLAIGYDDAGTEAVISSDPNAFLSSTPNVLFLRKDEVALIQKGKISLFNSQNLPLCKQPERLEGHHTPPSKGGFAHYMLKEIFEQSATVQKAIFGRMDEKEVLFEALPETFRNAKRVWFIGCGTSAHAGMIGSLFLEDIAQIPSHTEIASEARFRIVPEETLVIAISQSGETADTIAAVREFKSRGLKVLGICNVKNSTLTRETDGCIFLKAGPEMSVCSTKAFTSQIAVLYLLAKFFARQSAEEIKTIPAQIQEVLKLAPLIQQIAKKYSHFRNFFFMGRHYMYPTCLEAALKLKEISYVNANGYPAGELKHGPIALIDTHFPVVAFCANKQTEEKILSNLQEVKARGAPIIALAPKELSAVSAVADDVIWLPSTSDKLAPFTSTVAGQLLAYYIALSLGCDIDQPRNLAKSVTVE